MTIDITCPTDDTTPIAEYEFGVNIAEVVHAHMTEFHPTWEKVHDATMHYRDPNAPFECKCGERFSTKPGRTLHIRQTHRNR